MSLVLEPVANENDIEKVNLILDTEDGVGNEDEEVSNQSSHDEDPDSDSEQEVPTRGMDNKNSNRLEEECIIKGTMFPTMRKSSQ